MPRISRSADRRNEDSDDGTRHGGSLAVSCENVGFRYPGSDSPALDGVSFSVEAGEYVGVVGPNGGGKSTLVRLLNGLLDAGSGRVRVAGYDPAAEPFEVRRRVGVLFQNPDNGLVAPFVEDDVAFGLENLGLPAAQIAERVAQPLNDRAADKNAAFERVFCFSADAPRDGRQQLVRGGRRLPTAASGSRRQALPRQGSGRSEER